MIDFILLQLFDKITGWNVKHQQCISCQACSEQFSLQFLLLSLAICPGGSWVLRCARFVFVFLEELSFSEIAQALIMQTNFVYWVDSKRKSGVYQNCVSPPLLVRFGPSYKFTGV